MNMKTIMISICMLFFLGSHAQILDRVKNRAQRKIEEKAEQKTDEVIDDILSGKKKPQNNKNTSGADNSSKTVNSASDKKSAAQINSDFISGTKIIFGDDFSQDGTGDFPANWNTTGSGAVTTIHGLNGKWFSITHNSIVTPEMRKTLPENCTIEFDLFLQSNGNSRTPRIEFGLTPVKNILKEDLYYAEKFYMMIDRYADRNEQAVEYGLRNLIGNKNNFPLTKYENEVLHIAMAINGSRIRIYFDGEKLIDLPRALTATMRNNFFITNVYTIPASELGVLVGNVRIAEAGNDARSSVAKQLKENGKFTTNDILFDVNKDIIKPSSYSILNEVGKTMQQDESLKIKIVGHTDSDGDANDNQQLSEKRAFAVKSYLQNKFSISLNRMSAAGMGESRPISNNATSEGKAKNRRVEFIKM